MKRKIQFLLILMFTGMFLSCNFFNSIFGDPDKKKDNIEITALTLAKNQMSLEVGGVDYINVSIKPSEVQKNVNLHWEYDDTIISCDTSSCWGIVVTGIKEGKTQLKCSYNGYDAVCIITVTGYAAGYEEQVEPYIYSNTSILTTSPGITETVYVSLYGGTAADIDGYTWSIDNSSVATIMPTGQYCKITAVDSGYTRIKITHNKAAYPYYIGIYVFEDETKVPYITTTSNILTISDGDGSRTISCSLMNKKDTSLDSNFTWQLVTEPGTDVPVRIETINNQAVITPLKAGSCTIRITHPDAVYPLEILCRVVSIVKNVYIQPDNTIVTIDRNDTAVITNDLIGLEEGEYNIDDYTYELDADNVAEITSAIGNQIMLKGLNNGSCKLIVSHPKAAYTREILIIVTGQLTNALDASIYITTSQNYIRTKVGEDAIPISISLKGGNEGDSNRFKWTLTSTAADGSSDNVVTMETTDGTVEYRAASSNYINGRAYITPVKEGTAVLTLTHPKVEYPTEVLIKVLPEYAVLEDPLYFSGTGIITVLNGQTANYTVSLNGKNKRQNDEMNIAWEIDNSLFSISHNETECVITAPSYGMGKQSAFITVSHEKADVNKKILVLSADTEDELQTFKVLYSDKLYYNVEVNDTFSCAVESYGFDTEDDQGNTVFYNFAQTQWTVNDPSVLYIEKSADNPLLCNITALKSGTAKVRAEIDNVYCEFTVTVYPEGTVAVENEVYFTTSQNVISINNITDSVTAKINPINMNTAEYRNIVWTSENSDIARVIGNGEKGTITAVREGETIINVSHPLSQNTLKIYVRVGSEYIIQAADPVVYISSNDVITMLKDASPQTLNAVLVNYSSPDSSGFSFSIDNQDVAQITAQSPNGIAYVKPVGSGQAEITISHTATELVKKVLVVVGNSQEELAGYVYLSTTNNVVAVGEGNTKNISVSVQNAENPVIDGYSWTTSNPAIIGVTGSGPNAVLTGNGIGTAIITVSNSQCQYPLTIIAQCVDPVAAASNPYIQLTSSVITLTVSNNYTNITADLIGGKQSDYSDFIWTSNDPSICMCYGQNEVGKIKALKAGTTYITVSHPKANYSAQILVVCDNAVATDCYISVPQSIYSLKPTDSSQTITASLINGETTDKYNFKWSLDVYDVIDLVYSANVATITPKQTGQATITLSHPKSGYDQQIIVKVEEYSTFAFPAEYMTVTQGDVKFLSMQVPTTNVTSHIEYSVGNANICSISGTKTIAQLTAVGSGTTTVRANLVASSSGVVLATAECMIYVQQASVNAVYISSASTIYTVNKGKSQTLSALLSGQGVTNTDQYNFKWTTNDTDIIQITGINQSGFVTGQSVYITAVAPGEALITCSHEKAQSDLQFYVVVPGSQAKSVLLNKTYVTMEKGSSGIQIKATIENSDSSNDYANIQWSASKDDKGNEICRVMGSGQTVTIYPLAVGECTVSAYLEEYDSTANCTVIVQAGKSITFESATKTVMPFKSKTIKYIVSPPDAVLTWTATQDDDYFSFSDLGHDTDGVGYVEVNGIKQGAGNLICVTDSLAKSQIKINVSWDYTFSINKSALSGTPDQSYTIGYYNLNPPDANIVVESSDDSYFTYSVNETEEGKGNIIITPVKEFPSEIPLIITAYNPVNNDVVGTKTVKTKFVYDRLKPVITFLSSDGNFSNYDENASMLTVGDDEEINLKFEINTEFANGFIKEITWNPATSTDTSFILSDVSNEDNVSVVKSFKNTNCYDEYQYRILKAYQPSVYYHIDAVPAEYDARGNLVSPGSPAKTVNTLISDYKNKNVIYWKGYQDNNYTGFMNIGPGYIKNDFYGLYVSGYSSTPTETRNKNSLSSENHWYCFYYNWTDKGNDDAYTFNTSSLNYTGSTGYYNLVEDTSEAGKIYSQADFEAIPWFYQPAINYGAIQKSAQVMTRNVDAVKETSDDTSLMSSSGYKGTIKITVVHNGMEEKPVEIQVYDENRRCSKNYE